MVDLWGYRFKDTNLWCRALTHKSVRGAQSMEQLEFLGDTVLNMLASEYIVRSMPSASEGAMSIRRSAIVCNAHLAHVAVKLKLGPVLYMGRGEECDGGRQKLSILSDAVEAIIGAIYMDGGLDAARQFVTRWVL